MAVQPETSVLFIDAAPWFGGAQRSLLTLLVGLKAAGREVSLLTADTTPGGLLDRARAHGIAAAGFACRHWPRSAVGLCQFVGDCRRFRPLLRQFRDAQRPGILHANGIRSALLLRRSDCRAAPLVFHARDLRTPHWARRRVAARAARVLAISACVAREWEGVVSPQAVHVVPNGFDVARIRATVPADLGPWAAAGAFVAVLVADAVAWKRHELFLEALRVARVRLPPLRGLVVGRVIGRAGAERLRFLLELSRALGLAGEVRFVTDATDALPWVAAADLLVSTSAAEPFGRTIVEALALGRPVVATAGFGPQEILAGCRAGSVVESTAAGVAAGICGWGSVAARRAVAASAQARAADFGVDRMLAGVAATYAGLRAT